MSIVAPWLEYLAKNNIAVPFEYGCFERYTPKEQCCLASEAMRLMIEAKAVAIAQKEGTDPQKETVGIRLANTLAQKIGWVQSHQELYAKMNPDNQSPDSDPSNAVKQQISFLRNQFEEQDPAIFGIGSLAGHGYVLTWNIPGSFFNTFGDLELIGVYERRNLNCNPEIVQELLLALAGRLVPREKRDKKGDFILRGAYRDLFCEVIKRNLSDKDLAKQLGITYGNLKAKKSILNETLFKEGLTIQIISIDGVNQFFLPPYPSSGRGTSRRD